MKLQRPITTEKFISWKIDKSTTQTKKNKRMSLSSVALPKQVFNKQTKKCFVLWAVSWFQTVLCIVHVISLQTIIFLLVEKYGVGVAISNLNCWFLFSFYCENFSEQNAQQSHSPFSMFWTLLFKLSTQKHLIFIRLLFKTNYGTFSHSLNFDIIHICDIYMCLTNKKSVVFLLEYVQLHI